MSIAVPTPSQLDECLAAPARVVTTAFGPVEYAERGHGPAVLVVHGTPGGYDQGLIAMEFATSALRLIAPSRPGYLGTPLSTGRTPAQQADALAALLDELGIDQIPVVGVSGGGPSTYLLAARHPDRVSCLVEIDSICLQYPRPDWLTMRIACSPSASRLTQVVFDRFPLVGLRAILGASSTLDLEARKEQARRIAGDPERVALMSAMTATACSRVALRGAGLRNDNDEFEAMERLALTGITCPTLIVHGAADKDVTTDNARYAHQRIPSSELRWIADGSHFAFWLNDDALMHQQYVLEWLLAHR